MKILNIVFLFLILISIEIFPQMISYSKYTNMNLTFDGNLTEWNFVDWIKFRPTDNSKTDSTMVASMWNKDYLFFAFVVSNSQLKASRNMRDETGLYKDDGVEFLIDPELDKSLSWQNDDIAYHINILNVLLDEKGNDEKGNFNLGWNGDIKSYVKLLGTINDSTDIDIGYVVEIGVPWTYIGKDPHPGLKMGIDYCVNDTDDQTGQYFYYDWMGLKKFHNPSGFGIIELVN